MRMPSHGMHSPSHSRTSSLAESIANVTAGFVLAVLVQCGAYPLFGITTTIAERHPQAGVESIRVSGPDAPTWKRGPRTVQGRGPRDTYG